MKIHKIFATLAAITMASAISMSANAAGGSVQPSHKITNDTKNQAAQATEASREDFLTYTLSLSAKITGSMWVNDTVEIDLSGILSLADMIDTGGGILNGEKLSYNNLSIAPGETLEKTFRVRVKAFLPAYQYVLQSSFGNNERVIIEAVGSAAASKTAPNTGAMNLVPWMLGIGLMVGFGLMKKFVIKTI